MIERHQTVWAEQLPDNCPPETARTPSGAIYYRMVDTYPPTGRDFFSHRKLRPDAAFNTDECLALSVSLFSALQACARTRKRYPALRRKKIVCLEIPPRGGVMLRTGHDKKHYSWWRLDAYDPLPVCRLIEEHVVELFMGGGND